MRVLTVGHSNRAPEAFLDLVAGHGVTDLVDIRTVPRSRHNPWTAIDRLPDLLATRGIRHHHFAGLGGRRRPRPDTPNLGWRHEGFRGYADHMDTAEFREDLARLIDLARDGTPCVMCAEAVPWRCHRKVLADALLVRGLDVFHIMENGLERHELTPFARVEGDRIVYPPPGGVQQRLFE